MLKSRNAAEPLSFISLIPLWLSPLNRPNTLTTREIEKDESDPPKTGGDLRPFVETCCDMSLLRPHGVALVLIYPCGKAQNPPLSPRASSCRIGPRRQGFASPLRALDCSGPIRKTRCLRGERGVVGSGRVDGPKGSLSVIPGLLAAAEGRCHPQGRSAA